MAQILIPQKPNKKPDIYDYGFDKNLVKPIKQSTSTVVYNMITERLAQLIPSNNTIANQVPGLPTAISD